MTVVVINETDQVEYVEQRLGSEQRGRHPRRQHLAKILHNEATLLLLFMC